MVRKPLFAWLLTLLVLSATSVSAQDDSAAGAEPAAEPSAEPPAPEAAAPAPAAEPEPEPPPPPPPEPERRYEGQVSPREQEQEDPYGEEPYGEEPDYSDNAPDDEGGDFEMPPWSIRLDPFNWLIEGRLGLELEVGLLDWLTVEMVPVFVADDEPPSFNFSGREDAISQESNGLGPIAGTSLGVGFWLGDKPLQGYVLRVIFTNYGFNYQASDGDGVFDEVVHTERRLVGYFGSHARFGFFTISGGIGLGYELNQAQRCFVNSTNGIASATSGCRDDGELHMRLNRATTLSSLDVVDLNGLLHPIYLEGRLSLGVAFD